MLFLPLHGAAGAWDEILCLAVPASTVMAVVLIVLRSGPVEDDETPPEAAPDAGAAPARSTSAPHEDGPRGES